VFAQCSAHVPPSWRAILPQMAVGASSVVLMFAHAAGACVPRRCYEMGSRPRNGRPDCSMVMGPLCRLSNLFLQVVSFVSERSRSNMRERRRVVLCSA